MEGFRLVPEPSMPQGSLPAASPIRSAWSLRPGLAALGLLALLAAGVSPAVAEGPAAVPGAQETPAPAAEHAESLSAVMVETKLLFGLSSKDGSGVSEQEWADFLDKEITSRFPDGLTVIAAYGQVKGEAHGISSVVKEDMRLVLIIHPDTPEAAARLDEIRKVYSARFHQWGVLQVSNAVRVVL